MPEYCCAVGCRNKRGDKANLSFYRFPRDLARRQKWIAAISRKNWTPTDFTRICNDHFIKGREPRFRLFLAYKL